MGRILVGISAWADPELIESRFYPPQVKTPQDRLNFYASNFPVVEMDSSYHFMPTQRNLAAWIAATPAGFVFDVKAFSLLTQHPTPLSSLPVDFREKAQKSRPKEGNLYSHNLPEEMVEAIWERFAQAVLPLYQAGKMGIISFQFPPWFHPKPENYDYLSICKKKLPRYPLAVEFRTGSWLSEENRAQTLRFLRENSLSLVSVDEPQGLKSSVSAVAEVTASPGVVRFHGRNQENWERKDIPVSEKYNYLYSEDELNEWVPRIRRMADESLEVYVIFKNKHFDYAVRNARQMQSLLGGKSLPSPSG
jgi:uncharacterized protein YecE (DUF72 family)